MSFMYSNFNSSAVRTIIYDAAIKIIQKKPTVSSDDTVNLSLDMSLQTCMGDKFKNSSCWTTSL